MLISSVVLINYARLFEPVELNLPQKYAELLSLIWFSLFYVFAFPLGLFLTVTGVAWTYIIDKVFFVLTLFKSN